MEEKTIQILLVEDNPGDVDLIHAELARYFTPRFRIVSVDRLRLALELVSGRAFDVVLLDLTLPDSDGVSTLPAFRVRAPEIPVVVLTGRDDDGLALTALRAGAQDYLIKGRGDGEVIRRAILYAIERRSADSARLRLTQVEAARIAAENGLRSRDEFISIAAHELRTPLTPLTLHLAAIERIIATRHGDDDKDRFAERVGKAIKSANRLTNLIEVTATVEAAHVTILVRDRGIGIAPDAQANIFRRYERAVSNREYGGLGLGLYIAHRIAVAHGGTIDVESTVGAGSTFRVTLPRHRDSALAITSTGYTP